MFSFPFGIGSARTAAQLVMINGLTQYIRIVKTIMEFFDNNEPRLNFFRFSDNFIFSFCNSGNFKKRKKFQIDRGVDGAVIKPSISVAYDRHVRS